jgi:hypothetical protein
VLLPKTSSTLVRAHIPLVASYDSNPARRWDLGGQLAEPCDGVLEWVGSLIGPLPGREVQRDLGGTVLGSQRGCKSLSARSPVYRGVPYRVTRPDVVPLSWRCMVVS